MTFGNIANISTVLALIPLGFLVRRMQQQWRLNRMRKNPAPKTPGSQTGVLIFNIFEGTIEPQVYSYMKANYPEIDLEARVFSSSLKFKEKMIPYDVDKFRHELRVIKLQLQENNIHHVHLFIKGPMLLPLLIGDELANNIHITFHSLDPDTHEYTCWGEI
jgi:hypothetical protein